MLVLLPFLIFGVCPISTAFIRRRFIPAMIVCNPCHFIASVIMNLEFQTMHCAILLCDTSTSLCTKFKQLYFKLIVNTYIPISIFVLVNEIVSILFLIQLVLPIIQVTEDVRSEKINYVPTISSVSSVSCTVEEKLFASLDWSTNKTSIDMFLKSPIIYVYIWLKHCTLFRFTFYGPCCGGRIVRKICGVFSRWRCWLSSSFVVDVRACRVNIR